MVNLGEYGRKQSYSTLRNYPGIWLEGTEKNQEKKFETR